MDKISGCLFISLAILFLSLHLAHHQTVNLQGIYEVFIIFFLCLRFLIWLLSPQIRANVWPWSWLNRRHFHLLDQGSQPSPTWRPEAITPLLPAFLHLFLPYVSPSQDALPMMKLLMSCQQNRQEQLNGQPLSPSVLWARWMYFFGEL